MALKPIIIIPARMASTRLPNKPLADIHGKPMIVHVMERALESKMGPVLVACAEQEIKEAVEKAGGNAVLTDPDLPSGSDRILQALEKFDTERAYDVIINVQGDLPTLDPALIKTAFDLLQDTTVSLSTLAAVITKEEEKTNPNVVKAIAEIDFSKPRKTGRAVYFTRATAPSGEGPLLHHIGLYAYKRLALQRFVGAPPSQLEKRERLEQLRALGLGMRIEIGVVDTVPLGVDTQEDLEAARRTLAK